MADAFGVVDCDLVKGEIAGTKSRVETWAISGKNGIGAAVVGSGGPPFTVTCTLFGTSAEVQNFFVGIEGLTGTLVTIVKDGLNYPTTLVVDVGPRWRRACVSADGAFVGKITATCQRGA